MASYTYTSRSEADTVRLGRALAKTLPAGSVIALDGPLGAGKTRLVQAIAEALGVEPGEVVSPTFVLMQHHEGTKTIHHLDAYRIRDDDEFLQLGVDEYFESGGLVFIEWASRVARCLPPDTIHLQIEVVDESTRQFTIDGPHFIAALHQVIACQ